MKKGNLAKYVEFAKNNKFYWVGTVLVAGGLVLVDMNGFWNGARVGGNAVMEHIETELPDAKVFEQLKEMGKTFITVKYE